MHTQRPVTHDRLRILLLLLALFTMGSGPCGGEDDDDGGDVGADDGQDDGDDGGGDGGAVPGDIDGDGTPDADDACPLDPGAAGAGETCRLTEACAIVGDAEGTALSGEPARAHAGRFITLSPGEACGQDFDLEWFHGSGSAGSVSSREREDLFLLFAREMIEMRVLYQGRLLLSRSLLVEAIEVPVAAEMLVEPIKPTVVEQAIVTVSAIVDGSYQPVTSAPGVVTVDYELLALDATFRPAGVLLAAPGQTAATFAIPPQPAGWYMARAIARDAAGAVVGTPLPASFEFVAEAQP